MALLRSWFNLRSRFAHATVPPNSSFFVLTSWMSLARSALARVTSLSDRARQQRCMTDVNFAGSLITSHQREGRESSRSIPVICSAYKYRGQWSRFIWMRGWSTPPTRCCRNFAGGPVTGRSLVRILIMSESNHVLISALISYVPVACEASCWTAR